MAAWDHRYGWTADVYYRYRKYVMAKARSYEKSDRDCADLSVTLMIEFAAKHSLCVTFQDAADGVYISKAKGLIRRTPKGAELDDDVTWNTKDEFLNAVLKRTSAWDLFHFNSRTNEYGPTPGDLMLRAKKGWFGPISYPDSHAALVFGTYRPGQAADSEYKDDPATYPNFPGGDVAMKQLNQTRYFRGDVDANGVTLSREVTPPFDKDIHFNFLNSRGDAKRNAELIYFANARQLLGDGFSFCEYSYFVTDNWPDFKGDGVPSFRNHKYRDHR
jgi:hypothetical protein